MKSVLQKMLEQTLRLTHAGARAMEDSPLNMVLVGVPNPITLKLQPSYYRDLEIVYQAPHPDR